MSDDTLYRYIRKERNGESYMKLVPVEPEHAEVWWCKTHEVGQTYDDGPWWDEWSPYTCALKAEYPVEGDCVPAKMVLIGGSDG